MISGEKGMLDNLTRPQHGTRSRNSSWDRTGGNADHVILPAHDTHDLLDVNGAGTVKHIWLTLNTDNPNYLRDTILQMHWDNNPNPAVITPLGDFFALGHARTANVTTTPITVTTGGRSGKRGMAALNSWFHMPYSHHARISLHNDSDQPITHLFYYVDYDTHDAPPDTPLRFHAHYRQEHPTTADVDLAAPDMTWEKVNTRTNPTGEGNYIILDTQGAGHYVGCVLSIDHLNPIQGGGWFGEGDDMIFIDDRPGTGAPPQPATTPGANNAWPPTLHGTGTEDYFCAAWGYPTGAHNTPNHGVTLAGETEGTTLEYAGKWTMYRYHLTDPIAFQRAIRVTIEHGHANCHADDYSSVAYWYQTPCSQPLPPLPPAAQRRPRPDRESLANYLRTRK